MQKLNNAQRAAIYKALADARAPTRYGHIDGYDPTTYSATVIIQPEGIKTGWLPIMAWGSGGGFGDYWGLIPGSQVAISHFEGDRDNGLILGITPNDEEQPPAVPSGENWKVHKSGSFLKFTTDGSVSLSTAKDLNATVAGKVTANVTGDLDVTVSGAANLTVSGKTILACSDVELGAAGGKKVALDGDSVVSGKVVASSTNVKAT